MKKTLIPLVACVLLAACRPQLTLPDATEAAYDMYLRFADHEGLTVAMLGDYYNDTCTINAVMLQAQDSLAWLRLMEEFGILDVYNQTTQDSAAMMKKKNDDTHHVGNPESSRQFLEDRASLLAGRLQRYREIGDSNLAPRSPSPLLESWMAEKRVGTGLIMDYHHDVMWIFVYCDLDQLRDIFCYLHSSIWYRSLDEDKNGDRRDPVLYTQIDQR